MAASFDACDRIRERSGLARREVGRRREPHSRSSSWGISRKNASAAACGRSGRQFDRALRARLGRRARSSGGRRCRMLWATFADPDANARLAASPSRRRLAFGVEAETTPFPHVTLCRAPKRRLSTRRLTGAERPLRPPVRCQWALSLFSSRLTPRGPIYREIGAWRLGGSSSRAARSRPAARPAIVDIEHVFV